MTGTFIVAFSGGYDSMCLLDVLSKITNNIVAVHLNHNWRGEESQKEEENCRKFAQSKNIKYYTETLSDNIEKTERTSVWRPFHFLSVSLRPDYLFTEYDLRYTDFNFRSNRIAQITDSHSFLEPRRGEGGRLSAELYRNARHGNRT